MADGDERGIIAAGDKFQSGWGEGFPPTRLIERGLSAQDFWRCEAPERVPQKIAQRAGKLGGTRRGAGQQTMGQVANEMNRPWAFRDQPGEDVIGGGIETSGQQPFKLLVCGAIHCLYATLPSGNRRLGDAEHPRGMGLFDAVQQTPSPERNAGQGWLQQ